MANNKVQLANGTVLIDLTDTTATATDVVTGSFFYDKSGIKREGTLAVDETYSITKTLTNATSTNDDTKVIAGNSFFADLTPTNGYTLHEITVTMGGVDITSQVFKPGIGAKVIRANGTYLAYNDSLSGYSSVTVNVPSGSGSSTLGTKTITENGTYEAEDDSLDGYSSVTVNVPTGTARTSADLTASGATVTVPAGLYAEQATKAVASGSASTPATSLTANPSISVSTSGLITATASASQSITPTVSAGYVSSGTAGTISVSGSNTQQLSTQAAATITPTKASQTAVSAGKYTTGAVTVAAIPNAYQDVSNVNATAADVVLGKTIVTADGVERTGTLEIQRYYTGSSEPTVSVGSDGDIYLMTS